MIVRASVPIVLSVVLTAALVPAAGLPAEPAPVPVFGADLSFLDELERGGATFSDEGVPGDAIGILSRRGFGLVRLRLWHAPAAGADDLARTIILARRAKAAGMKILLDLHFSDTWADPGRQRKPAAWMDLPFPALADSVFAYTRDVVAALKRHGVLPEAVQLGNEITSGLLWDEGRVGGAHDTPSQWERLGRLLESARAGLRAALDPGDSVAVLIHLDRGGDADGAVWFLDRLIEQGVAFDAVGLSYYPWWHGTLDDLRRTLGTLARRYGKPLLVVETAYPWTLDWFDDTHNIVGREDQLHPGFPATVEGQRRFLAALITVVEETPGGLGRGVVYWAPEAIAAPDAGSPVENLALFGPAGELLDSVKSFEEAGRR